MARGAAVEGFYQNVAKGIAFDVHLGVGADSGDQSPRGIMSVGGNGTGGVLPDSAAQRIPLVVEPQRLVEANMETALGIRFRPECSNALRLPDFRARPEPSAIHHELRDLRVIQHDVGILTEVARPFDLPAEHESAERVIEQLAEEMDRNASAHDFSGKGMGPAAPQIGISRATAAVRPAEPGAEPIVLINPRITATSDEQDEQFEGCLSFFDVCGLAVRPPADHRRDERVGRHHGDHRVRARARPAHPPRIDHLDRLLYLSRVRSGVEPISVEQYRSTGSATGRAWADE